MTQIWTARRHRLPGLMRRRARSVLAWIGFAILTYIALATALHHPTLPLDEFTPITFDGGTAAAALVTPARDVAPDALTMDAATKATNAKAEPRECNFHEGVTSACVFE